MRRLEWALGLLSAVLALAAMIIITTQTQHVVQNTTGSAVYYGAGADSQVTVLSSLLACGLVVVAALLVALGAAQDARRLASGLARGGWRWLVMVGAALSVVGVYLLILSNLWLEIGGSAPAYASQTSVALLFVPATLAAILCAVIAALPRGQRQAPALA